MTDGTASGVSTADTHEKGLSGDSLGLWGSVTLGVSSVAPAYTLTATLGLVVAAVGFQMPVIFIAGFIPMFLTAYAYRELNRSIPDCGTSFTWATKAFGPYVGWMCGWGLIVATVIVLSNLAGVAVSFFYLFLARLFGNEGIADLAANKGVNIVTCLVFIAAATAIAYRGITTTQRLQAILVGFQMVVLAAFVILAIGKSGGSPTGVGFSLEWFNPFGNLTLSAFVAGLSGSIFAFWGWDTCLTVNEESKDADKTPGRAALLCVTVILTTYLLVAIGAMMYAGVGSEGLGLGNEVTSDNVFGALAEPILGHWPALLLFLAVLASSAASLQTTFLPPARTLLAMGEYKALPAKCAHIHPRFRHRRQPRKLAAQAGRGDPAAVHQNADVCTLYAQGRANMIAGNPVMRPVVDEDGLFDQPAAARGDRLAIEQGGIGQRRADLDRGAMPGALDPVEDALFLLRTAALEIADHDRCGRKGQRGKQGGGTKDKADFQAFRLWRKEK